MCTFLIFEPSHCQKNSHQKEFHNSEWWSQMFDLLNNESTCMTYLSTLPLRYNLLEKKEKYLDIDNRLYLSVYCHHTHRPCQIVTLYISCWVFINAYHYMSMTVKFMVEGKQYCLDFIEHTVGRCHNYFP